MPSLRVAKPQHWRVLSLLFNWSSRCSRHYQCHRLTVQAPVLGIANNNRRWFCLRSGYLGWTSKYYLGWTSNYLGWTTKVLLLISVFWIVLFFASSSFACATTSRSQSCGFFVTLWRYSGSWARTVTKCNITMGCFYLFRALHQGNYTPSISNMFSYIPPKYWRIPLQILRLLGDVVPHLLWRRPWRFPSLPLIRHNVTCDTISTCHCTLLAQSTHKLDFVLNVWLSSFFLTKQNGFRKFLYPS